MDHIRRQWNVFVWCDLAACEGLKWILPLGDLLVEFTFGKVCCFSVLFVYVFSICLR